MLIDWEWGCCVYVKCGLGVAVPCCDALNGALPMPGNVIGTNVFCS